MRVTVPVTPDADTAREWAREELRDSIYDQGQSWADRLGTALTDFIAELFSGGDSGEFPIAGLAVAVLAVAIVIAVSVAIIRPVLKNRRARGSTVMDEDERTAKEIRGAAADAAGAGQWALAVMERFRAIVTGVEERAIIDERPGRTAYEAARDAGQGLPTLGDPLLKASRVFDAVCYGHREATESDYHFLSELDERVMHTRPALQEVPK